MLLICCCFEEFYSANWVVYTLAPSISPQGKGEHKAVTKSQGDLGISHTQVSDSRLQHFTSYAGLPNGSPYAAVKWHALATSASSVTPQQRQEKQKDGVIPLTRPNFVNSFVLFCAGRNVKTREYTLKLVNFVSEKSITDFKRRMRSWLITGLLLCFHVWSKGQPKHRLLEDSSLLQRASSMLAIPEQCKEKASCADRNGA